MIRRIKSEDAKVISDAFAAQGWDKPIEQYIDYVEMNKTGKILTLVAFVDGEFAGYGNLFYTSNYPPFLDKNIPEIVDLNTLIKYRKTGIATKILDKLESYASEVSDTVGIGVGMIKDYGPAQRLYVKRGYVPDGRGVHYDNQQINYFDTIAADDSLVLYLTKKMG